MFTAVVGGKNLSTSRGCALQRVIPFPSSCLVQADRSVAGGGSRTMGRGYVRLPTDVQRPTPLIQPTTPPHILSR